MDRRLGNYTIQGEIGRGGMATVYLALQESLDRVVALKELDLSRLRNDPHALERFRLEARAAAALRHPHIVTIYDLWEEDGRAYIAMEFMDGVELREAMLNLGSVPHPVAGLIALAVGEALQYAHDRGMIHRDVKPGNIMLSAQGDVRLMDFGIVSVAGSPDITLAGQILGTPAYMSPEQIAGEEVGPAADLFSLGAVLYEMISGRKPFSGANHIALIQDVLHGDPPLLHELDPQVPESISRAVAQCLAKNPQKRYGSVEEFATVLEMVMPLERPERRSAVSNLVGSAREQVRTRLHTEAGALDRTSPMVETPRTAPGYEPSPAGAAAKSSAERPWMEAPLVDEGGASPYRLEQDPPADLPPLESALGMGEGSHGDNTGEGQAPAPLALKEVPELEEDTGKYIEETSRPASRRSLLWLVPVILLAALVVWKFAGIQGQGGILQRTVKPPPKGRISILAEGAGSVFMDGEPVGKAEPSLELDVEPGLHRLEVRHLEYGSRKYIVELGPGERKVIEVDWQQQD